MSKFVKAVAGVALTVVGVATGNPFLIGQGIVLTGSALLSPSQKQQARQAAETAVQLGEVPRQAAFGEVATAGALVDAFNADGKYGTLNETLVLALADHECEQLIGFYVDDKYVAFDYGGGAVPGYDNKLFVDWYPGTETQVPYGALAANGYGPNDNLAGVAFVAVTYGADDAKDKTPTWPGGRPRFLFVVKGAKLYDPRKDSTVPGGSGPHRWDQPSTWEWSDNPIVCRYNWARGIYACNRVGQPDQLLIGRGLSAIEAPPENVAWRANICDELVPLKAGGSEKRYRFNGIVKADEEYLSVEENFAATCGGIIVQPGGAVEIEPGHARTPTFVITDADLIVGSNVTWSDFRSEADGEWLNTVHVRYVEPAQKWADHEAAIRRNQADIVADRRLREDTVTLTGVTSATQAQRCGEIRRRMGRLLRSGALTVGPRYCDIEEGDWGYFTSARRTGGVPVLVRVESYASDRDWQMQLVLREISPAVYDWNTATDELADGAQAVQQAVPDYGAAPTSAEWSVAGETLTGPGGQQAAIRLTGAVPDGAISDVVVEVRRPDIRYREDGSAWLNEDGSVRLAEAPGGDWEQDAILPPDASERLIQGLAPGAYYIVGLSYIVAGQRSERLEFLPVQAGSNGGASVLDPPSAAQVKQTGALTVQVSWRNPRSVLLDRIEVVRDGVVQGAAMVGGLGAMMSVTDTVPAAGSYTYVIRATGDDGKVTEATATPAGASGPGPVTVA